MGGGGSTCCSSNINAFVSARPGHPSKRVSGSLATPLTETDERSTRCAETERFTVDSCI